MERNKNIEAMRGIAMLGMLIYHYSISISGFKLGYEMQMLRELLGQISLISFFVLSGFGTYMYFFREEENGKKFTVGNYVKKRLKKLLPPYYICIGILIVFTSKVVYLNSSQLFQVLESVFLVQNFDPYNTLNGVTWTIATLAQLYFFAGFFYKWIRKKGLAVYPFVVVGCILIKMLMARGIIVGGLDSIWLVVIGIRLPFTICDLYLAGMCSAYLYLKWRESIGKYQIVVWRCFGTLLTCVVVWGLYLWITKIGIYGDNVGNCVFQSLVGLIISVFVFWFANEKFTYQSIIGKGIQCVARNEYGIFLWHMIIMGNLVGFPTDWWIYLNENNPSILLILTCVVSIGVGLVFMRMVNKPYKNT